MHRMSSGILGLAVVLGLGCPTPPEPTTAGVGGEPPAPGEPGAQGGVGGAPVTPGGLAGAEGGVAPPPVPGEGFAKLIAAGQETVTIHGSLQGQTEAIVDFVVDGEGSGPQVIHTELVEGGAFELTAPATYEHEIYVAALIDAEGDGPSPDDQEGFGLKPFRLDGSDVTLVVTFDERPGWADDIFKPLEGGLPPGQAPPAAVPPAQEVPADGEAAPAGGGPPTGDARPAEGSAPPEAPPGG